MNFKTIKFNGIRFLCLLVYSITAIVLFLPVLDKNFVSDDYIVLKRVCLEKTIWVNGFFRPLSDFSIYINYFFSGLNPVGFNLVNIVIHGLNSFLLFQLCLKWKWSSDKVLQHRFAIMASLLFITYPFHNESIVWLLGRGSSIAGTFVILAMLIFLSGWKDKWKIIGVSGGYLTGLLAYETIMILPLIIFILLLNKNTSKQTYLKWATAFFITAIFYMVFRYNFSGSLIGSYGEDIIKGSWQNYLANFFKVISRLIIPPIKNSHIYLITSVTLVPALIIIFFRKLLIRKEQIAGKIYIFTLLAVFCCTVIIAVFVGVSTRTSEGDRLLYIPSIFLCCLFSFFICRYIRSRSAWWLAFILLCSSNIIFLEMNNYNWHKAGKATSSMTQLLKHDNDTGKIYVVNLPNEINGAYVFREGFKDALVVNKIDTLRVTVINKLSKEMMTDAREIWKPVYYETKIFIPPFLDLIKGKLLDSINKRTDHLSLALAPGSKLYYWNNHEFILLNDQEELVK